MAKEGRKARAVQMSHHNCRVEEEAFASLYEQEIEHLILGSGRHRNKWANAGKNFAAKADIAMGNHRDEARFTQRQKFVELYQVARGAD
jgi:hypothetical protein